MNRLLLQYLLPVGLINIGNACAYAFQIILTRTLSTPDVGAFNAMLAAVTFLAAPASVAPLAIQRLYASQQTEGNHPEIMQRLILRSTLASLVVAVVVFLLCLLLMPWVKVALKIDDTNLLVLFALLLAVTVIYPIAAGWYQALGKNLGMAVVLSGVPIWRFLLGLPFLLWLGMGLSGAMLSAMLPCLLVFIGGLLFLQPSWRSISERLPKALVKDTFRFVLPAAASATLIYALFNLDVVMVRILFSEVDSGLYAVAAVIGRIPFLLPAALANIFFSDLKRKAGDDDKAQKKLLLFNLLAVGVVAYGLAALIAFFAEPVLSLLAGPQYVAAAPIMRISCFAMASLALLNLLVTFGMARDDHSPLIVLALGIAAFVSASFFLSSSIINIAIFLGVSIFFMVVLTLILVLVRKQNVSDRSSV